MDFIYSILTRPPLMPKDLVFRRRVGKTNPSSETSDSVEASKNKETDLTEYIVKRKERDDQRENLEEEYKGSTSDKKARRRRVSLYSQVAKY